MKERMVQMQVTDRKSLSKKFLKFILIFGLFFQVNLVAEIPSSDRSQQAITKVRPIIEKRFNEIQVKYGTPIFIRIFKESKELEVWVKKGATFTLFKTYEICYFSGDLGAKLREGDGQSPEGFYTVKTGQLNPNSNYHLAFNLGYPNAYDVIHNRTGNYLMVHGKCVSIGCYAMTDKNIEEIYSLIDGAFRNGQSSVSVHIFPFRLTTENLERQKNSDWFSFWTNLKVGYDLFEKNKVPPMVTVKDRKYAFISE